MVPAPELLPALNYCMTAAVVAAAATGRSVLSDACLNSQSRRHMGHLCSVCEPSHF